MMGNAGASLMPVVQSIVAVALGWRTRHLCLCFARYGAIALGGASLSEHPQS